MMFGEIPPMQSYDFFSDEMVRERLLLKIKNVKSEHTLKFS